MSNSPLIESYLDLATTGRVAWWRYLVGVILICVGYLIFGTGTYVVVLALETQGKIFTTQLPTTAAGWQKLGFDPIVDYYALNSTFVILIIFVWLVVLILHRRSFLSIITFRNKLSWKRIFFGFGVWAGLCVLASLSEWLVYPQHFKYAFSLDAFVRSAVAICVLTPIQCFAEEIFFRGYLMQALSLLMKNSWLLAMISGLLFALPHFFNLEMAEGPLIVGASYFAIGFGLGIVALRSRSLEISIGAHAANNLYSLAVNSSDSSLMVPSVFLCTKAEPLFELVTLVVCMSVLYWATTRFARSN